MDDVDFLSLDDVPFAHRDQSQRCGGDPGVRDLGLLASAIAQPQAAFGGQRLHAIPFEKAAACLYHLVQNSSGEGAIMLSTPCQHNMHIVLG